MRPTALLHPNDGSGMEIEWDAKDERKRLFSYMQLSNIPALVTSNGGTICVGSILHPLSVERVQILILKVWYDV